MLDGEQRQSTAAMAHNDDDDSIITEFLESWFHINMFVSARLGSKHPI